MKQQKLNTVQLQHINTPQACPEVPKSMSRFFLHLLHYVELSPANFKHAFYKCIFCGSAYLICINLFPAHKSLLLQILM